MPLELNQAQREAMSGGGRVPLVITNPDDHQDYVLLPASEYDRLRAVETSATARLRATYAAQTAVAAAAGWDDPIMDEYDEYDAHREARP